MITAELTFSVTDESGVEAVELLMATWLKNGQIDGGSWLTAFAANVARVYVSVASPAALADASNNIYATQALESLAKRGMTGPDIRLLGVDPDSPAPCQCTERSSLILLTNYLSKLSPVSCGTCFRLVPLYCLPHIHDHEHLTILQWAADYRACDTLQMHGTTGERFGEQQLWQHDSALSRQGREIARQLSERAGVPVYYFLLKSRGTTTAAELARACPSCGGKWGLATPWHDFFDFRCDACRLVSKRATSLTRE